MLHEQYELDHAKARKWTFNTLGKKMERVAVYLKEYYNIGRVLDVDPRFGEEQWMHIISDWRSRRVKVLFLSL